MKTQDNPQERQQYATTRESEGIESLSQGYHLSKNDKKHWEPEYQKAHKHGKIMDQD